MLPFEERLEQFGRKAEASIDELIVLTQSAPVAESAVAAQAVLGRYGRLVAQIGEIAAQHQLSGAHAVCALVETNLLLLQDDKRALTPDETATLEAWPMLLLGYVANHADRDASIALLQSLAAHWPISLPLESAAEELLLLMGQAAPASSAAAVEEPAPAISGPAKDDAGETALLPVAPEPIATREIASAEVAVEQAPLVSAGFAGLAAEEPPALTFSQERDREDAIPIAPSLAALDVGETTTEPEPDPGAISSMQASLTALAEDELVLPDHAGLEPPTSGNVVLEPSEPGIASTVAAYLNEYAPEEPAQVPAAEAAAADSAPDASTSQPAAAAESLPETGEHNDSGAGFAATLLPPATGTQNVTRPMLDILLDELKPLNEAFESVIAEATHGSDDDRLAALGELLDFMERLKLTVETIGLTALSALLTRIKIELVLLPGGLSEHHRELLRRLPRAMVAYLQAPDAPAAAAGLVVLLADTRWSTPLAGHTLAAWRAALADIALSESPNTPAPAPAAPEEIHAVEAVTGDAAPGETAPHDMPETAFSPDAPAAAEPALAAEPAREETPPAELEADDTASGKSDPEGVLAIAAGDTAFAWDAPAALTEPVRAETPAAEALPQDVVTEDMVVEDAVRETAAAHEAAIEPSTWQYAVMSAEPELPTHAESAASAPRLPPPDTGGQYVERPMVQILLEELQPLNAEFLALVSAATEGVADDSLAALGDLLDLLERVKITVEGIGLTALAGLLAQIGLAIVSLPDGLTEEHRDLLHGLPDALTTYLDAPDHAAACAGLVAVLADGRWPVAASEETRAAWCAALADVELSETSAQMTPIRATEATLEDVSLELPAEVNSELLDGLLQELPVQVSAFTSAVASITGPHGTLKDAEQAMRAAHTLKGAANTVGIPGIANLTHQLEDILVALREAESLPQGKLADVLTDAGDCLEAMSEFLLGVGAAPDNAQAILQKVLDVANRIDSEGIAEFPGEAAARPVTASPPQAAPAPGRDLADAGPADRKPQPQAATEQSLRVPAPLVDELLSLAGETLISNSQLQDHLKSTIIQNHAVHQQHRLILKLVAELETLVDIRGITSQQQGAEQGDGFDALEFEHYNELQTISRQLMEATTDAREMSHMAERELDALEEVLGDQQRLQMANQHALLRTRMMPVSNIIPRLQRSVRQTGRLLDKQVEFTVKGEGTRMDTNVLNDLMDPLMHMLRNAVDHGIETPEARMAEGKSPEGHIELAFAREGDTIVVRCRDDGAGLDHAAIRRIAESKGMIVPGHIHTNEELSRLILMPGFSTRDETSQVSGRGVGMDVVYGRVQQMKGMLSLNSQKGKGLTIELRLPATLLSMHALIIRQRERRFAVSTRGVEDIRYVPRENVVEIGARQFVRDGEKIYALLRLEQALAMPPDRRAKDRAGHPVLLLRMEDGSERAVLVQEVLESREIVMKKFNRFVPQVSGVIGAAILGNGEVAPVIDLFDLLQAPVRKLASAQRGQGASAAGAAPEEKPKRALVVDDSLSARRAVVQLLKDEGYEIRTANDGLEAVSVLERWIPDIIISDMEMPRMNGLELTSNVRHAEQTRDVPVIMITSRSTAKHRQMSAAAGVSLHMIKPFSDDELVTQVSRLTEKAQ